MGEVLAIEPDQPMPPKLDPKDKSMTRQIVITPEWLALVEEWRRHQNPVPNVSAAIRRMVEIAAADEAERRERLKPKEPR